MSVFSYHLLETSPATALKAVAFPPPSKDTSGLIHSEWMTVMTLGSPVFSPSRMLLRQVAVFAQWEDEQAINRFLDNSRTGRLLATGWHVRLEFMRQWGSVTGFEIPNESYEAERFNDPVVAVTLARMRLFEVPRFIHWGRPVEALVRDHPGTTLALASFRFPRTVSTFSVWKTQKLMTDMVRGHSSVPDPKRHVNAMKERDRRDFHFEFTTLRFNPLSEAGEWSGRTHIVPGL